MRARHGRAPRSGRPRGGRPRGGRCGRAARTSPPGPRRAASRAPRRSRLRRSGRPRWRGAGGRSRACARVPDDEPVSEARSERRRSAAATRPSAASAPVTRAAAAPRTGLPRGRYDALAACGVPQPPAERGEHRLSRLAAEPGAHPAKPVSPTDDGPGLAGRQRPRSSSTRCARKPSRTADSLSGNGLRPLWSCPSSAATPALKPICHTTHPLEQPQCPGWLHPVTSPASPVLSAAQLETLAEHRRGADGGGRRHALPGRRPALPVHRDPRGRGGDPRRRRARDRPPRALGLPRASSTCSPGRPSS